MAKKNKALSSKYKKNQSHKQLRTNHLLIIGVDEYSNGIAPLNNAVKDAKSFLDLLLKHYQFEKKNVTTLFNRQATRGNIISTFRNLLNDRLTDKDNLLFYYSGHGEVLKSGRRKRGFWIPYDAVLHDAATYLSNNAITELFQDSYAHHILGIVDSCFSGSLFQTRKLGTVEERLESAPSRWLLTAGRMEVVSDGSLGDNSPFAKSLLTHLKTNTEKALWTSDLCNRVLKSVSYNTNKQTPRGEPLHNVGHMGGQFVFYKKGFVPSMQERGATQKPSDDLDKGLNEPIMPSPNLNPNPKAPTTLAELKAYLKELIAKDIKKAIELFKQHLLPDSSKTNDLILLESRYNSTKDSQNLGLVTFEQANRAFNQIKHALLDYIDDLEEEEVRLAETTTEKITYNNAKGEQILLDLSQLEQAGFKKRAELIIKKLNKLKDALVIETDAARQFQYETQIEDLETQLKEIKDQL